jgi:hypothetical protein
MLRVIIQLDFLKILTLNQIGCYIGDSRNYTGNWPITARGLKCKSWVDTTIGEDPALFPDDTVADARNYCRHTSSKNISFIFLKTELPFFSNKHIILNWIAH